MLKTNLQYKLAKKISNDELYAKTECYSMATQKTQVARTCAQNGTEKDSQEGLNKNPPGKRKQGRPKMTMRKTFEGYLKKGN